MRYEEFREFINENMQVPTDEQRETLMRGKNTMHYVLLINKQSIDILQDKYDLFINLVYAIKERGAVPGYDYIILSGITPQSAKMGAMSVQLHVLSEFISVEEDLPGDIKVNYE